MSETENRPAPFSEQTVEPEQEIPTGVLYREIVAFLSSNPGPQTVKDIHAATRPNASWQKVYYQIQGMVEVGALIKTKRGILLGENAPNTTTPSWMPPFITEEGLHQYGNRLDEDDIEKAKKKASNKYIRDRIYDAIVIWNLRSNQDAND